MRDNAMLVKELSSSRATEPLVRRPDPTAGDPEKTAPRVVPNIKLLKQIHRILDSGHGNADIGAVGSCDFALTFNDD